MEGLTLGIAIASLIIGIVSLVFGFIACYKIIGVEKSTHTVQYMPVEDAVKDPFKSGFDSFMGDDLESKLQKDNELFREELEEIMPQFAPSEEDKKIISW